MGASAAAAGPAVAALAGAVGAAGDTGVAGRGVFRLKAGAGFGDAKRFRRGLGVTLLAAVAGVDAALLLAASRAHLLHMPPVSGLP